MELFCLDASDIQWQELLQDFDHDFYHLPGYVSLEAHRLEGYPEALYVREGEHCFFLPYILRSTASVLPDYLAEAAPFDIVSPYGYPSFLLSAAACHSPEFIQAAFQAAIAFWQERRICSAFLRLHPLLLAGLSTESKAALTKLGLTDNGETVAIDLSLSTEELEAQTSSKHRNNVRRVIRENFVVRWGSLEQDLAEFVEIYTETMARVNATQSYFFDEAYFRQLAIALKDKLHLCIVEQNGITACASLVTETCGVVQYHLSGSRTEMMKFSPNKLMLTAMRDWAKARGNRWLHLGGGLGGSTTDPLFQFKALFSPLRFSFETIRLVINENQYEQLIHERGKCTGAGPEELLKTGFFPAYRASTLAD